MKSSRFALAAALAALSLGALAAPPGAGPGPRYGCGCGGDTACIEARREACPRADEAMPCPMRGRGMMGRGLGPRGACAPGQPGSGCPFADGGKPALPPAPPKAD